MADTSRVTLPLTKAADSLAKLSQAARDEAAAVAGELEAQAAELQAAETTTETEGT